LFSSTRSPPDVLLDRQRDVLVEWRQDLVGELHDSHFRTAMAQVLRHLHSDVSRADHDGSRRATEGIRCVERCFQARLDLVHVVDVAQHVDAGKIGSGQRQLQRIGALAQRERVVGLGVLPPAVEFAHRDRPSGRVQRNDIGSDAHVDVQRFPQALGSLQEEPAAIGDHSPDVIREPAVRERHIAAALEHDDLGRLIQASCASSDRCTSGHTSDNDDLHQTHLSEVQGGPPGLRTRVGSTD
jgi:hypothetical protein